MLNACYVTFENPVNAEALEEVVKDLATDKPFYEIEGERAQMRQSDGSDDPVLETEMGDCYLIQAVYPHRSDRSYGFDRTLAHFNIDQWRGEEVATAVTLGFPLEQSHLDQLENDLGVKPNPSSLEGY